MFPSSRRVSPASTAWVEQLPGIAHNQFLKSLFGQGQAVSNMGQNHLDDGRKQ